MLGKSIQSCTYEPLPDSVPQELRQLVTSMLQAAPASRPTIAKVASYVDEHVAKHYPVAAPAIGGPAAARS